MKFAHLSDCHIGGWRQEEMKRVSIEAFTRAMEICVERGVDFVIIAGDLFDTSLPSITALKEATRALKKMKDARIPVFLIPGSHDYSPSGKTMLDVLEHAGLCTNVCKLKEEVLEFTEYQDVKITGIEGLMGGLDRLKYESLKNREDLEREAGFKIFVFHTLLTELKPGKEWELVPSESLKLLPRGFDYYAGGHPHFVMQKSLPGYKVIAYPGPLSPNNFKEIEELKHGGFYLVTQQENGALSAEHVPVKIKETRSFVFDATKKSAASLEKEIKEAVRKCDVRECIVTMRVFGTLESGKPSDINFKEIVEGLGCYVMLKNTSKLVSKEFEEVPVDGGSVEDIELNVVREHAGQISIPNMTELSEEGLVQQLMVLFDKEKDEGETNADFEARVVKDVEKVLRVR